MEKIKITVLFVLFFAGGISVVSGTTSRLMTDRDLYVSGEDALISIFLNPDHDFKVLYLTLSGNEGSVVHTVKLQISNHQASGHFYLPDSLKTGSFLLTAFSPHFKKQPLVSKEIVVLNRFENTEDEFPVRRAVLEQRPVLAQSFFSFRGLQESYRREERVQLEIDGNINAPAGEMLSVCVSRCGPDWESRYRSFRDDPDDTLLMTRKEGVVLQGVVKSQTDGKPVGGAQVFLSGPDSIPFFDFYTTWGDGRFYFVLPHMYGSEKLVLQAQKEGQTDDLDVCIDDLFDPSPLKFRVEPFGLDDDLRNYMNESIQLVTFQKIYGSQSLRVETRAYRPSFPFPFYGSTAMQVDPDDYFEMGDFNEVSKELLQPVRFRKRKEGYSLEIVDYDLKNFLSGKPMVLIDGVPVSDLTRIASMGSNEIDWIDVVPYQRFFGTLKMDGVLAIYTKKRDASAIPSSPHLLKLNFETLQEKVSLANSAQTDGHAPDFRQTLYWNPNLNVDEERTIGFTIPDVKGTYRVYLLERKADGELLEHTQYFTVSE